MPKKINKTIEEELNKLLGLIQIKADIETSEQDDILVLKVLPKNDEDISLLVGWHGQTLSSLQSLLKIILSKKLGDDYKSFIIDISDYRQKREDFLTNNAKSSAEKVKSSGHSIVLDPMTPSERRIVHLALTDFDGIATESIGDGQNRRIVIRLENS